MSTRRRLHQQETTTAAQTGSQNEGCPLILPHPQLQQQYYPTQSVSLFAGAESVTAPHLSGIQIVTSNQAPIVIGESPQPVADIQIDVDDKYTKAKRQWVFRLLSSRLQASSGQALRTYIQQPLSAAAAVVTGNHPLQQDNDNYSKVTDIRSNSDQRQSQYEIAAGGGAGAAEEQEEEEAIESDLFDKDNIIVMAARDRTGEFTNAIRSLQSRNITRAVNIRDPRKAKQVQSYSEFMMVAKYIGKNIASTYVKLEKLTLLAKKKSLFDDRPQEIQELTYIIKGDLNALNQQIARLQEISKDQRRSNNGKHLVSHSSNMVLALQSKLASMSTDFKQILEVRTENLKQQKSRRDQFGQGPLVNINSVAPSRAKQGSLLLSEENQAVSIDMSSTGSDTTPLLGPPARLQMQQQIALYDESDNYVQQRAETMQSIESTIVELGGIFQQLAYMVKEQEEIVERIDTNVHDAEINIEAAHGEILKYFQSVSKNRWLMIKIFGVLILFFIFFVVFLT